MSNILKSSEVIIDSKKYVLTEKIKIKKEEKKDDLFEKNIKEEKTEDLMEMKSIILEEAKKESDEILKNALQEKELMMAQTYDESIKIREKAKKEGFEEGLQEAIQSMKEKEMEVLEEALNYKNEVVLKYDDLLKTQEEKIIDLVLNSVEKILNKEVVEDEELIENLVREGIEKSTFTRSIVIRVCERDYEKALFRKSKILTF
ncbi:FliH/SctL family protein, partial [Clostridiaceae bacterium HSG29]|nr:FliH/SctL family protein [Clostridiaceae bacterium HSG29]